jgi:hypothetical protein
MSASWPLLGGGSSAPGTGVIGVADATGAGGVAGRAAAGGVPAAGVGAGPGPRASRRRGLPAEPRGLLEVRRVEGEGPRRPAHRDGSRRRGGGTDTWGAHGGHAGARRGGGTGAGHGGAHRRGGRRGAEAAAVAPGPAMAATAGPVAGGHRGLRGGRRGGGRGGGLAGARGDVFAPQLTGEGIPQVREAACRRSGRHPRTPAASPA